MTESFRILVYFMDLADSCWNPNCIYYIYIHFLVCAKFSWYTSWNARRGGDSVRSGFSRFWMTLVQWWVTYPRGHIKKTYKNEDSLATGQCRFSYCVENFLSGFPQQICPLSGRRNRPRICLPGDFNDIDKYNSFLCKLCELSLYYYVSHYLYKNVLIHAEKYYLQ